MTPLGRRTEDFVGRKVDEPLQSLLLPGELQDVLRELTLPALERGLERGGRSRGDVEVTASVFVATTDEEWEANRRRVAFYGSTPGYRHVLDHHGLGTLFEALHERSRAGGWAELPGLVDEIGRASCRERV